MNRAHNPPAHRGTRSAVWPKRTLRLRARAHHKVCLCAALAWGAASLFLGRNAGTAPLEGSSSHVVEVLPPPPPAYSDCRCAARLNASGVNRHAAAGLAAAPPPAPATTTAAGAAVPILVLKLPASGSSWLASLLRTLQGVVFTEELVTHVEAAAFTVAERQAYLRRALRTPRLGKMRDQYMADYRLAGMVSLQTLQRNAKLLNPYHRPLRAHGFSVNPRHVPIADWPKVAAGAKVVMYHRSNLVKHAVAHVHGRMLDEACATRNIKASSAARCGSVFNASAPFVVPVDLFEAMLHKVVRENRLLWEAAYATRRPVYELLYEDMQRDAEGALRGLLGFVGIAGEAGPAVAGPPVTTKVTSDSLRRSVVNFDEIEAAVGRVAPCLLPMARDTRRAAFGPCAMPASV